MRCTKCNHDDTRVVDSRESPDGTTVRRRRECETCTYRFTTFERVEDILPLVIKKSGQREIFDRLKILSGMRKACEKRPVSADQLEEAIRDIESGLAELGSREVSSRDIGERVIDKLRTIDPVAYVRFASVYREFSDVGEFMNTLADLSKDQPTAVEGTAIGGDKALT